MSRLGVSFLLLLTLGLIVAACQESAARGGEEGVLYQDSFGPDSRDRWELEGDQQGRTTLVNDQLLIEVDGTDVVQYATLAADRFDDFVLQVDVTQLAGSPRSTYGVLFRMQEEGGFYRFAISPSGYFIVELRQPGGRRTVLTDGWTEAGSVNGGLNQLNRLQVTTSGSSLAFFINGVFLAEVSESTLGQGRIALDAGTFGQGGLRVAFDDLIIRERE